MINVGMLDNCVSYIFVGCNVVFVGGILNNFFVEGGCCVMYVQVEYCCEWFYWDCSDSKWEFLI